jgi:hypothetical protein
MGTNYVHIHIGLVWFIGQIGQHKRLSTQKSAKQLGWDGDRTHAACASGS